MRALCSMNTTETGDPEHGSSPHVTVAVQTVGCKLNQAESEALAREFLDAGFKVVAPNKRPDVYILNTCTVTHIADRKCRQYLRSFHRTNPNSLVVAMGCYVDRSESDVRVEGVDITISNMDKDRVVEIVQNQLDPKRYLNINDCSTLDDPFRTRAMTKIQDGCSHSCSYCIVPFVRGPEHSIPMKTVLDEIEAQADNGCQEIVLTGTRIGTYEGRIEELIRRILKETSIPRIRLSSLQPEELSPFLIGLWENNDRVCRHIHLALQSGSQSVLERMNRAYTIVEYEAAVKTVRDAMPDIAVTTDIIVGFPGETDEEFQESLEFCKKVGFAGMHIFPYSARNGTKAADMPNKVADKVKKARSQIMLDLATQSARGFCQRFQGETMQVLWEERKGKNLWIGHTGNYIKVYTKTDEFLENCLSNVRLGTEYEQGLWGEIITAPNTVRLPGKGVWQQ
jgi:threonylcarbamoyladenosine tRNA methylthiotransferase MtaB